MEMQGTTIGDYLRHAREQRGLSIRGLASEAGVDASGLSKVERGLVTAPDPRWLGKVAQVLGIETTDLYLEAGYGDVHDLPGFVPYLRTKYDLPDEAIAQLEAHFELINEKYRQEGGGS